MIETFIFLEKYFNAFNYFIDILIILINSKQVVVVLIAIYIVLVVIISKITFWYIYSSKINFYILKRASSQKRIHV